MHKAKKAVGRCLCGEVKFLVTLPPKFCVHCHCLSCRVSHGAAVVTWLGVPAGRFELFGEEHVKWYTASKAAKHGFCDVCGTSLLFVSTRFPGDVHVTRASIIAKIDLMPDCHIYYDQHVAWFPFEDALPHLGGKHGISPLDSTAGTAPAAPRRRAPG
jgi:hypothetical protein